MSNTSTPSVNQLKRAIAISEQIEKLQADLAELLGSTPVPAAKVAAAAPARKGRRKRAKFSAEGLARIRAAQKARWAKIKGTSAGTTPAAAPKAGRKKKAKRVVSPEARAKMAAAARRRWAEKKKA
jgi:hypothetical protein